MPAGPFIFNWQKRWQCRCLCVHRQLPGKCEAEEGWGGPRDGSYSGYYYNSQLIGDREDVSLFPSLYSEY